MRPTLAAIFAALATAAAIRFVPAARASTGPIPLNCNRACLEDLVNQYLAAVIAHDPKKLPLSADVKYTENDQELEIITEIESVYYRQGGGGPSGIADLDKPGYNPGEMWFKSLPATEQASRQ